MLKFETMTEQIDLLSSGIIYPTDLSISKGTVEMKYPTAKEEDILTNPNYLAKNTATTKFIESIIVNKDFDLEDLIPADYDSLLVASRILAYGSKYRYRSAILDEYVTVDLANLQEKKITIQPLAPNTNLFEFEMDIKGKPIKFRYKLLTRRDINKMQEETDGLKKVLGNPESSAGVTTLLKYTIQDIDGETDKAIIKQFVESLPSMYSRDIRKHITSNSPRIIWQADGVNDSGEVREGLTVPLTASFFWEGFGDS